MLGKSDRPAVLHRDDVEAASSTKPEWELEKLLVLWWMEGSPGQRTTGTCWGVTQDRKAGCRGRWCTVSCVVSLERSMHSVASHRRSFPHKLEMCEEMKFSSHLVELMKHKFKTV